MKITKKIDNFTLNYNGENLKCTVPCSLYSVLLDNNLIENPYYRDNEYEIAKLSDNNYVFSSVFTVDEQMLSYNNLFIVFKGIDTLCHIYINGKEVLFCDNMHRTWKINAKDLVNLGENTIDLYFDSPTEYIREAYKRHPMWNEKIAMQGFGHIRKSHCMFGWDWGPTLPDVGIFRDIEILAYNSLIDNVYITQKHSKDSVKLKIKTEILGDKEVEKQIKIFCPDQTEILSDKEEVIIDNPFIWWPNGLGEHPLYKVEVILHKNGEILDSNTTIIGLRTLTISCDNDALGREFCFKINGKKIFTMGSNYIPEDSLIAKRNRERTAKLIEDCVNANHNCIRVWGGGFYPDDWFYDECDKNGIIVWQDFMFACTHVYLSTNFKKSVVAEFEDNLKRIRNRACLGILCGNNEIESYIAGNPNAKNNDLAKKDYLELFEHILPEICQELSPDTYYIPSSPTSGGGFEKPGADNMGDQHYWGCWHGSIPFEDYRNHLFRFCSEFGFESFPDIKTVKTFSEKEDLNPFSFVMESHQKCNSGNLKMLSYAADKYLYPTTFEDFVFVTQILQADAIRYGVEHFRRNRGKCMGSLYWQLNDCWPTASWSSIDYFGRWKALHYISKRFYAPIMISAHESGTRVTLNVCNETLNDFSGKIIYEIKTSDLKTIFSGEKDISLGSLSSADFVTKDFGEFVNCDKYNRFLCFKLIGEQNNIVSEGTLLFVKPKHFGFINPEISFKVNKEKDGYYIELKGSSFAKFVKISFDEDILPSDNFFDLYDNEVKRIKLDRINPNLSAKEIEKSVKVCSVYDIGAK